MRCRSGRTATTPSHPEMLPETSPLSWGIVPPPSTAPPSLIPLHRRRMIPPGDTPAAYQRMLDAIALEKPIAEARVLGCREQAAETMTTGSVQEIQAARTRVEAAISRPNAWSRSKDPPLKDSPARMPPTPSNSATLPRAFPRRGRPLQRFDEGLMLNSSHTPRRSPRSLRKRERQTPRGGAARGTGLLGPSDAGDPQPYAAGSTVAGCRGHPRLCHAAASDAYR
jgi:hypothetical protein